MLRALRQQVNEALTAAHARRRPALRRSDSPDALLATDLPLAAGEEAAAGFAARLSAMGWRVWHARNGWLMLDADVPVPQAPSCGVPEGEIGCCIAILRRHPEDGDARDLIRAVVKAAEAGQQPFERLCAHLHGEMAAMLRRHEPLPAALLPYLYRAVYDLSDRRNET